jgi:pimeloyl-ACP methyl ester carboxylesterase
MAATAQTATLDTRDRRTLCVEIAGPADGQPILIHIGTPNSRHLDRKWIEDAERRRIRLISYDRPGYGGSTPSPGHTVADGARDVEDIAGHLGIDRLRVWGLSGGGPYALACAALLPELVPAVATVGSIAPYGAPGLDYFTGMGEDNVEELELYLSDRQAARRQLARLREEFLGITSGQILESWKTVLSDVDAAVLTGDFAEELVESMHDGLAQGDQGWWDDGVAHMSPWGFDVASIRIPVKIWHGRHDRFVPFQHGQWLAEHIPNAEAELSENDGHLTLPVDKVGDVHEWLLAHP